MIYKISLSAVALGSSSLIFRLQETFSENQGQSLRQLITLAHPISPYLEKQIRNRSFCGNRDSFKICKVGKTVLYNSASPASSIVQSIEWLSYHGYIKIYLLLQHNSYSSDSQLKYLSPPLTHPTQTDSPQARVPFPALSTYGTYAHLLIYLCPQQPTTQNSKFSFGAS